MRFVLLEVGSIKAGGIHGPVGFSSDIHRSNLFEVVC